MLKNTALSSILVNIPIQILSFLGSILVVRLLGADFKGIQAFVLANMEFLMLLLGLSIQNSITYYISNKKMAAEKVLSSGFLIATIGCLAAVIIYMVSWYGFGVNIIHYKEKWINSILISYFMFAIFQGLFYNVIKGYLLGIGAIVAHNRLGLFFSISRFTMIAALFWWFFGEEPSYDTFLCVIGVDLIATIIMGIVMLSMYLKYAKGIRISFGSLSRIDDLIPFIRFSLKNHFGILLNFLNYRLDIWLLAYFMPGQDDEIGYYYMAVMLAQLLWIIPNGILTKAFQEICRSGDYNIAINATRSNMALLLGAIAIGATLGPFLIPVLYGAEFTAIIPSFLVMLAAVFWNSLTKTSAMFHYAKDNVHLNVIATAIGVVVTLILNVILIPKIGIMGAAISSLACYFVIFLFTFIYFRREIRKEGIDPNQAFKMFVPGLDYLTKGKKNSDA